MHALEEDRASVGAGSQIQIVKSRSSNSNDDNSKALLVAVVILALCSIVAIVLGAVAVAKTNDTQSINVALPSSVSNGGGNAAPQKPNTARRVFTIATGHDWGAHEYLDQQGYIQGFSKDLVAAVCEAAQAECYTVYDKNINCIDSTAGQHTTGGEGLLGQWYDACVGWDKSIDRVEIFQFGIPYLKSPSQGFFVKNGSTFDASDITGKKMGFIDGWVYNERCIARQTDITGHLLSVDQIFHYPLPADAVAALMDGTVEAISGDVQAYHEWRNQLEKRGDFKCELGGSTVMARKDNDVFINMWNSGFNRLRNSGKFAKLCEEGKDKHSHRGLIPCV